MLSDLGKRICERLGRAGVEIPPRNVLALHEKYLDLLSKWNRTINLTALPLEPATDEAIDRLLVEPISASHVAGRPETIIDLGSGGGSPAIPFWIQLPGAKLTMVESRSRKCAFLREAARLIRPGQAVVIEARFEDLFARHPELRGSADIVTIRAIRLDDPTASLVGALLRPEVGRVFHFTATLQISDCSTWNNQRNKERGSS